MTKTAPVPSSVSPVDTSASSHIHRILSGFCNRWRGLLRAKQPPRRSRRTLKAHLDPGAGRRPVKCVQCPALSSLQRSGLHVCSQRKLPPGKPGAARTVPVTNLIPGSLRSADSRSITSLHCVPIITRSIFREPIVAPGNPVPEGLGARSAAGSPLPVCAAVRRPQSSITNAHRRSIGSRHIDRDFSDE